MLCKICNSNNVKICYHGKIKTGLLGGLTDTEKDVYKCLECGTIWHEPDEYDFKKYYESQQYRINIEKTSNIENYYERHDKDVLEKLKYTGTDIYRNKVVADIGCGGGSFLDFINTVAKTVIAVEPSSTYREELKKKYDDVFQYSSEAIKTYKNRIDVITSFDVIEHVNSPQEFMDEIYDLLSEEGKIVIGTPTDYPVLRKMLGDDFNRFIFQIHHPWILSEKSMRYILEKSGFKNIEIKQKQKYGLGNLLSWLLDCKPRGDIKYEFISESLDCLYKEQMAANSMGEYIVAYASK